MNAEAQDEEEAVFHVIPHIWERQKLLLTFATAVARSHPDPERLLAALERTLREDEHGEVPLEERSDESHAARLHYEDLREMFLRIVRNRAMS
jgi:GrpB-like predicted nucleotidyltransferase (UPF0157 family)